MTTKKENNAVEVRSAFTYAGVKAADSVVQQRVNKECQYPVTPYKINDEDWKYGIGLN